MSTEYAAVVSAFNTALKLSKHFSDYHPEYPAQLGAHFSAVVGTKYAAIWLAERAAQYAAVQAAV